MALLAAAMLATFTGSSDPPAVLDDAIDISASQAPTGQCFTDSNLNHASANRATRLVLWAWARGSNNYLGWIWTETSLREGPAGTWTMVENCDDEPEPPVAGWPTVGYDLGSTRAAVGEDDISPENVSRLGRAWQLTGVKAVSGTPVVRDGTLYVGDWTGHVRALNATTGQQVWAQDLGGNASAIPGAVAVDDNHVYAGTWDGRLFARNRQTGAAVWEKEIDPHPVAVFYGSPVVADGKVFVPVASDEWWEGEPYTFRGSMVAYDAATGNELWRYWTTCGPENAGRNNCPAGGPVEGPGVATWAYPAVDLQRGLLYFGTGNQYSEPTSGRSDSLVALDIDTGQERWLHQFTANDWWNLRAVQEGRPTGPDSDALVASFFDVNGVAAVGVGDKGGSYYALNRDTGQVLWSRKLTNGSIQGGVMASATVVPGSEIGWDRPVIYVTSNRGGQAADLYMIDSSNGQVLWVTDVGARVVGPPTWANGLLYIGDDSGRLSAFHGTDGLRRVWDWDTPNPAAGGVSVVDGMVYAGWGYALTPDSPDGGLIAYKIDGEPQDDPDPPPDGAQIYSTNCAACHGADGSGGAGPSLLGHANSHTREQTVEVITNGRGAMPRWADTLTAEQIGAVADYVRTFEGEGHDPHDH